MCESGFVVRHLVLGQNPPAYQQSGNHSQPDFQSAGIIHIPALTPADASEEGDRTLDQIDAGLKRLIQEVGVEFQVDSRIELRQQTLQRLGAAEFVSGPDVGEGATTDMFQLQQLAHCEVAVINKRAQL